MQIHESGLLFIWKTRRWPKTNICNDKLLSLLPQKITLVEVQSAFYAAAIGIAIACVVVIVERLVKHARNKRLRIENKTGTVSLCELNT